jgi:hypothetical protein
MPSVDPNPLPHDGRIHDDVLVAEDGQLFLVGGAHGPLAHALGLRRVLPRSFTNFRHNLEARARRCAEAEIGYLHLVAPDKQSVLRESFDVPDTCPLGDVYAAETGADFCFPVEELRALRPHPAYEPTDTHWSVEGAGLIARLMAERLGVPPQEIAAGEALLERSVMPRRKAFIGDLGRKFDPPRSNVANMRSPDFPARHFDSFAEGNTGTMRLAIATRNPRPRRLLIFGDSFLQICMKELTAFFGEVLLCRSAFLHPEIILGFQPDYVITQNAERYLSVVRSDADAPPFLVYPQLKRRQVTCAVDALEALAASLTHGSALYRRFTEKFDAEHGLSVGD